MFDALLRAAIRRREVEAELLSIDGDPAARMRCRGCGAVLVETALYLRCMDCRMKSRPAFKANDRLEWEQYIEERRAVLERVAQQYEEAARGEEDGGGSEASEWNGGRGVAAGRYRRPQHPSAAANDNAEGCR